MSPLIMAAHFTFKVLTHSTGPDFLAENRTVFEFPLLCIMHVVSFIFLIFFFHLNDRFDS